MKEIVLFTVLSVLCFFPHSMSGDDLIQKVDDGFINWSELSVTLTGAGVPDLGISNPVSAKLSAEKAAKMNVIHRLSKALGKIELGKGKTLEKYLSQIKESSFLNELTRNSQWSSMSLEKQYSDGSTEYIFKFDISSGLKEIIGKTKDGFIKEVTVNEHETKSPAVENGPDFLFIDLRKLKAGRVIFPFLETSDNKTVLNLTGFHSVSKNGDALIEKLKAGNHLKIVPLKIKDGSSIIISKEDAEKIKTGLSSDVISSGRVIMLFK